MSKVGATKKPAANPFDSDSDSESNFRHVRASSAPGSSYSGTSASTKNQYRNDFHDLGGFENQSVQELENYAAYKAEETTNKVNDCLKIAEVIKEDATRTLVTLHQQGEQIDRTHQTAVSIDQDLSRGEKLLGSLGGIFSKTWKPKKTRQIKGPVVTGGDTYKSKVSHIEQRKKLGLSSGPQGQSNPQQYAESTSALEKVQIENAKQDDGLSDLSNILGQLKDMAVDMGSEIDRQNVALDHLHDDVEELNARVKGVNQRTRRLLGK